MELGGLCWTNVLNSALPPQRQRPESWSEHQATRLAGGHWPREVSRLGGSHWSPGSSPLAPHTPSPAALPRRHRVCMAGCSPAARQVLLLTQSLESFFFLSAIHIYSSYCFHVSFLTCEPNAFDDNFYPQIHGNVHE